MKVTAENPEKTTSIVKDAGTAKVSGEDGDDEGGDNDDDETSPKDEITAEATIDGEAPEEGKSKLPPGIK